MTVLGAAAAMNVRSYHVASAASSKENFQGRLQGLIINGDRILDEAHLKQIEYQGKQQAETKRKSWNIDWASYFDVMNNIMRL